MKKNTFIIFGLILLVFIAGGYYLNESHKQSYASGNLDWLKGKCSTVGAGNKIYSSIGAPCYTYCLDETNFKCANSYPGCTATVICTCQSDGTCPGAVSTCTLPWGGTLNSGSSVTAYLSASPSCGGSCSSETRTCNNGVLSGSYTAQTCSVQTCASCNLPWGGTLAHGSSVTAYQTATVTSPATCTSQSRTCTNGALSGTYTFQACTVQNGCSTLQSSALTAIQTFATTPGQATMSTALAAIQSWAQGGC